MKLEFKQSLRVKVRVAIFRTVGIVVDSRHTCVTIIHTQDPRTCQNWEQRGVESKLKNINQSCGYHCMTFRPNRLRESAYRGVCVRVSVSTCRGGDFPWDY